MWIKQEKDEMKKVLLASLICLPFASLAASDNTIQFQGEVTDQTCSVTVNGVSANPTVLLPTVPVTALDATGKMAGLTTFTVALTGCTAPTGDKNIGTIFVATQPTADGRITNTGSAGNVSLVLVDPAAPTAELDLTGTTSAPGLVLSDGKESASHDFAVQYYAEDQATAGSVLGSVQYAVTYQ